MPKSSTQPLELGDVFYPKIIPASDHFWVVAHYDKTNDAEKMIIFSFTSYHYDLKDHTCIIDQNEYSGLSRISAISYQHGLLLENDQIESINNGGIRRYLDPISSDILEKIIDGAIKSKFTPNKIKTILR